MKKKKKSMFGNFFSAYELGEKKSLDELYEIYKNDTLKKMYKDGRNYTKIVLGSEFYYSQNYSMIVWVDPPEPWRLQEKLVDETGREFTIEAFEMMRCSAREWAAVLLPVRIIGENYEIGNYLGRK